MSTVISVKDWLEQKKENQQTDKHLFLTPEEVRSSPHYCNATEEEVANIINTLHDLALLTYEVFCQEVNQENKQAA